MCHDVSLSISPKGRKEEWGCFSADLHQVEVLPVEYSSLSLRKTKKKFSHATYVKAVHVIVCMISKWTQGRITLSGTFDLIDSYLLLMTVRYTCINMFALISN